MSESTTSGCVLMWQSEGENSPPTATRVESEGRGGEGETGGREAASRCWTLCLWLRGYEEEPWFHQSVYRQHRVTRW